MNDSGMDFSGSLLLTMLALVVVLIIAWLVIRFLASLTKHNTGRMRAVKVLQTIALGSRERVGLVQYKGNDLLLGVTAGGISVIDKSTSTAIEESETLLPEGAHEAGT